MSIPCYVLPYEIADGPANMALDEALLGLLADGADAAILRTYGWTTPTLSLGYFQRAADAEREPRWSNVPLVRRLTGGGAIWHHRELTYALVVPAGHPLARPSTALYRAVHAAISESLVALGVRAIRRGDPLPSEDRQRKRPFLCFTEAHPDDIVTDGAKIVGSAQRRRAGAVLQHGSVLLARSWRAPELLGLCDLAKVSADPWEWSERLIGSIPRALGLRPSALRVPDEVRKQAVEMESSRYRNPAWTQLR
jgi:lipoate-protein ligase A